MRRPTFFEGVGVAFGASLFGGVLHGALSGLFFGVWPLQLLITAMALGYLLYLLSRTQERVGRVSALLLWALVSVTTWLIGLPLPLYLLLQLGLIWLVRSLYFYSSLFCALADLGLTALGLAAAVWAMFQTGNLFLAIWCFFLLQALFVAIPASLERKSVKGTVNTEDSFQHARRAAETALRKLSSAQ